MSNPNDLTGQSIGRYTIVEALGQGGMATVYRAYDTRLECDVAVKVIRRDAFPPELLSQVLARFEREAKALAQLNHPNIVKVIDYGEYQGIPYLVMPYLPGGTLRDRCGHPLDPWEAARILIPIARALDYAHHRGVLHRDVKPSNVLITDSGEMLLGDFGIAKLLDAAEGRTLTGTGVGIGTPEYMAPEQGMGNKVDGRADVYALGVVLYELVTGRKPYTAETPMAVLLKHITDPLPLPRQFRPDLPEAVERVIIKALAKQPEDRYTDMAAFAAALERLSTVQVAKQAADADQTLGTMTLVPPAGNERQETVDLPASGREVQNARQSNAPDKDRTGNRRLPVPRVAIWASGGIALVIVALAFSFLVRGGQTGGALATATVLPSPAILPTSTQKALIPTQTAATINSQNPRVLVNMEKGAIIGVAYSPDGRALAVASASSIDLYDPKTLSRTRRFETGSAVTSLAFSHDGLRLAAGLQDRTVQMWNVAYGDRMQTFKGHDGTVISISFSQSGANLATGSTDRTMRLWSVADGSLERTVEGHTGTIRQVAFIPKSTLVVSNAGEKIFRFWRQSDGNLSRTLNLNVSSVISTTYSPDVSRVAITTGDKTFQIYRLDDGSLETSVEGLGSIADSVAFSPVDALVALGTADGTVQLRQIPDGKVISRVEGQAGAVKSLSFSPDGRFVASASEGGTVRVWEIPGK